MNVQTQRRYDYYLLLAFAFTAISSIALQNFIWLAIAFFFFTHWRDHQKIDWPSNLFTAATLIFLATFFIGAVVGVDPLHSFKALNKYLSFLVLFPLGAMTLTSAEIRRILNVFIAGASICALYGIIYKHFILHQQRIDSFSGDKMVFGGMLMVSLIIVLIFLKKSPRNIWYWLAALVIGIALILTQTRGAWLGAAAGFFLLAWRLDKRWVFAGVLFFTGLFFILPKEYQNRIKSITDIHFSYTENMNNSSDNGKIRNASQSRLLIWISGARIIHDYPWGIGQGNLETIYPKYRFNLPPEELEPTIPHLHDNYLQICVQNGWLGLAAYLFWIFAFYFEALRFKPVDPEADRWNWMLVCVFTAILVWGLTEYTFSQQFMNIQFFFMGIAVLLWKNNSVKN